MSQKGRLREAFVAMLLLTCATQVRSDSATATMFQASLDGANAYECSLYIEARLSDSDSSWLYIPLPDGPVSDVCGFEWRPSTPSIAVTNSRGVERHFQRDADSEATEDGVVWRVKFEPQGSADKVAKIVILFDDTLVARINEASLPLISAFAPVRGEHVSRSQVATALHDLMHRLQSPHTLYDVTASQHPDSVLTNRRGACDGFTRVTQRALERYGVRSRAVVTLLAPFKGLGRESDGSGTQPHSFVEYEGDCEWIAMEPTYSHNFIVPQIRLASADSVHKVQFRFSESMELVKISYRIRLRDNRLVLGRPKIKENRQWIRRIESEFDYHQLRVATEPCTSSCRPIRKRG